VKRVALFGMLLAFLATTAARPALAEEQQSPQDGQKMVVHLSHFTDDLHSCFMALKLGTLMQKSGSQVTLFLDLEGVRLAERRQTLDVTWGASTTPLSKYYEEFTESGGKVLLCPHCAHAAHIGDMALKRHAEIGNEQVMAKMLLAADKILDY